MSAYIVNCSSVAQLMESEAREKTHELIARISEALLTRLNSLGKDKLSEQTCDIEDANLLRALSKESDHYDIINSLLTCYMIIKELFADSDLSYRAILNCYETTTQVLENFTLLQRVLQGRDRNLVNKAFTFGYDHLDALVSSLHSYPISLKNFNKKNSFVDRHLNILYEARYNVMREPQKIEQYNYGFIRQLQLYNKYLNYINAELRYSLNKAYKYLVQVELKLITILNERYEYEQEQNGAVVEELKEELAKARMEIDRMDEYFRIYINVLLAVMSEIYLSFPEHGGRNTHPYRISQHRCD